jgi:hypothetical protein
LPIFFSNTSARGWRRRVEFNNTAWTPHGD